MRLFAFLLLFFSFMTSAFAADAASCKKAISQVNSISGNIYYSPDGGHVIQVTHSGKDSSPVLSPDKQIIAFTRVGGQVIPEKCDDNTETKYGNQVWIYKIGEQKERLLVANNFDCNKPEKQIVDPSDLLFSPDSKTLYFLTSAWVTSGALHAVKVDGTDQRYIVPANSFEVVNKGEYKGYLLVYQHRYFIGGGTYDWSWMFSPEGKEEGPLGEEITKDQRDFIESDI